MRKLLLALALLCWPLSAYASRWTSTSFTTDSIAARDSDTVDQAISSSIVNIGKITVTPSSTRGTTLFEIYKEAALTNLIYSSGNFSGTLYDPVQKVGNLTFEASEGFVVPYEDLDGGSELHIQITNNSRDAKTYTVTIYYEVPTSVSMVYPGVGVARSTGSAWTTSYTVGTSPNNLVQLNSSAQLPAVDGSLLTNLSSMTYPGAGVPLSTGSAWGTSYSAHGDGSYVQLFTGTTLTDNCAKFDSDGNIVDAGVSCGPSSTTPMTTLGDILYGGTSGVSTRLAGNTTATRKFLLSVGDGSNAAAPSWSQVVATTDITGTLGVSHGGTGLTSGTSGGVLAYTASGTLASSTALADNYIVVGGGAGAAPTTSPGATILTSNPIVTGPYTLTVAGDGSIAVDASDSSHFRVTLTTDCPCTLSNPSNLTDGQKILFEVVQASGGSETLALDTKFTLGADITDTTVTTTADKRDFIAVVYNSGEDLLYVIANVKGY